MSEHLDVIAPIEATRRDEIRDELRRYALDTVFLDGVSADVHHSAIVNAPYFIQRDVADKTTSYDGESLFELT